MSDKTSAKPLVFACSGCSFAGKLADDLARHLDRQCEAEMSCLCGIGARRPSFLAKLRNREVWVIDGCAIECARGVFELAGHAQAVTNHIRLHELEILKHHLPAGLVDLKQLASDAVVVRTGSPPVRALLSREGRAIHGQQRTGHSVGEVGP